MNNTITFELCAEDRQRIDTLLTSFGSVIAALLGTSQMSKQPAPKPEQLDHPATAADEAPFDVTPAPEPPKAAGPTRDDLRNIVRRLIGAGTTPERRDRTKAIIKEYAATVSDIPEDKIAEALDRLTALEKEAAANA